MVCLNSLNPKLMVWTKTIICVLVAYMELQPIFLPLTLQEGLHPFSEVRVEGVKKNKHLIWKFCMKVAY